MSVPMNDDRAALAEAWRGWTRLLATGKAPTTRLLARDAFAAGWDAAIEAAARSEGSGLDALREATEAVVREARDLAGYRSGGLPITPGLDVALRKYDAALAAQEEASDD